MNKGLDIFLRVLIVASIFGGIGYYYYTKFTLPSQPILKSDIIKLPNKDELPIKDNNSNILDNKSDNNSKINLTNSNINTIEATKYYRVTVNDLFDNTVAEKVSLYLKKINLQYQSAKDKKEILFKRVLVGPFKTNKECINAENKLKSLKMDTMKLTLKNGCFVNVGSFVTETKVKHLTSELNKNSIHNITLMEIKVPKDVFTFKIDNLSTDKLKDLEKFFKENLINYKLNE